MRPPRSARARAHAERHRATPRPPRVSAVPGMTGPRLDDFVSAHGFVVQRVTGSDWWYRCPAACENVLGFMAKPYKPAGGRWPAAQCRRCLNKKSLRTAECWVCEKALLNCQCDHPGLAVAAPPAAEAPPRPSYGRLTQECLLEQHMAGEVVSRFRQKCGRRQRALEDTLPEYPPTQVTPESPDPCVALHSINVTSFESNRDNITCIPGIVAVQEHMLSVRKHRAVQASLRLEGKHVALSPADEDSGAPHAGVGFVSDAAYLTRMIVPVQPAALRAFRGGRLAILQVVLSSQFSFYMNNVYG